MFLRIEENPNCEGVEGRVFTERSAPRGVGSVLRIRDGREVWCDVVSWGENGAEGPPQACKVDDSGEGSCFLIYGGVSGLRLKEPGCGHAWSLRDPHQWGEPFLLLPPSGEDLRFSR